MGKIARDFKQINNFEEIFYETFKDIFKHRGTPYSSQTKGQLKVD